MPEALKLEPLSKDGLISDGNLANEADTLEVKYCLAPPQTWSK
jgi:hypothetical protein